MAFPVLVQLTEVILDDKVVAVIQLLNKQDEQGHIVPPLGRSKPLALGVAQV